MQQPETLPEEPQTLTEDLLEASEALFHRSVAVLQQRYAKGFQRAFLKRVQVAFFASKEEQWEEVQLRVLRDMRGVREALSMHVGKRIAEERAKWRKRNAALLLFLAKRGETENV